MLKFEISVIFEHLIIAQKMPYYCDERECLGSILPRRLKTLSTCMILTNICIHHIFITVDDADDMAMRNILASSATKMTKLSLLIFRFQCVHGYSYPHEKQQRSHLYSL